jgi:acetyl-CoA carboxylase carboxyltransferase component
LADKRVKTEDDCFDQIRQLLSYLPSNNGEKAPRIIIGNHSEQVDEEIGEIVPTDPRKSYDMRQVIRRIFDNRAFFEIKEEFARNILTGFSRLNGYPVGVIANQPLFMAGSLTIDSSDKEARFIRFCDAFNIPLIFLVDTTGFLPGTHQEHGGILRHGAKVLYAISESVVPKIAVLVRKAYGGAKPAMGIDKDIGIDYIYAWPTGESAIMGAEAVAEVIYGKEIAEASDPEGFRQEKIGELRQAAKPYPMVYGGLVDDIIEPGETRGRLSVTLESLLEKKEIRYPKRHGNIPL